MNFRDPDGLLQIEAADRTYRAALSDYVAHTDQKEYFDPATKSIRVKASTPSPVDISYYNDIKKSDKNTSVTVRAGGGGAGTLTVSGSGVDFGAGVLGGAGVSITIDHTFSFEIKNAVKAAFSIGGSTNVGLTPIVVGVDVTLNASGLSITPSIGFGVGTPEGHFLVTQNFPKEQEMKKSPCPRQGE